MTNPAVTSGDQVRQAQIDYLTWMAEYAHSKGMVIGLKNALCIIPDTVSVYDFAVNENCYTFSECSSYAPFISANKAVFSHIYKSDMQLGSSVCFDALANKLVTQYCPSTDGHLCTSDWTHCKSVLNLQFSVALLFSSILLYSTL